MQANRSGDQDFRLAAKGGSERIQALVDGIGRNRLTPAGDFEHHPVGGEPEAVMRQFARRRCRQRKGEPQGEAEDLGIKLVFLVEQARLFELAGKILVAGIAVIDRRWR